MALWTLNQPPKFKNPKGKELIATAAGWTDPDTHEVLIAIPNLTTKAGPADVLHAHFGAASYMENDLISVIIHFNEAVDVTIGASIEVSWSGFSGNFSLNAAAQLGVTDVVFNKQFDNATPATVPAEAGDLSLAAQSISGTIKDAGTVISSNLAISSGIALAAGIITVS